MSSGQGSPTAETLECPMEEIAVFPQGVLSDQQGLSGVRRWYYRGHDIDQALRVVCASHWPGNEDCRPVNVQWGAADDKVVIGPADGINESLPSYNQYLIVAQYQLLHISNQWAVTGKPKHPKGTVLALQVRGGAEILQIDPVAVTSGSPSGQAGCLTAKELAGKRIFNARIRIPLTDYRLVCDRLTNQQLCNIMYGENDWIRREGTVNNETGESGSSLFLGYPEGTLMFDTWTLDHSFVPDVDDPHRWRLSCTLKARYVPHALGPYPDDCRTPQYPVGWNHDFKMDDQDDLGWKFIMLWNPSAKEVGATPHGDCPEGLVPRYPYKDFSGMFCDTTSPGTSCHSDQENNCIRGEGAIAMWRGGGSSASVEDLQSRIGQILENARGVASRTAARTSLGSSQ